MSRFPFRSHAYLRDRAYPKNLLLPMAQSRQLLRARDEYEIGFRLGKRTAPESETVFKMTLLPHLRMRLQRQKWQPK